MIALLLACGPKSVEPTTPGAEPVRVSRKEARAAAEAAAAAPPPPTLPDLTSSVESPELKAGSNLELTSLTWSYVRFSIAADTAALNTIEDPTPLQRHLAADPRWKVHHRNGVLTAEQRVTVEDGWRLLPSGYHEDSDRMWRVAVRFGERAEGDPWSDEGLISESKAGDAAIKVDGIPMMGEQEGRLATAIVVEAPTLAVEIFESGPEGDRSVTATALGTVPVMLPGVSAERVATAGFDAAWLSSRHVQSGEPTASLTELEPGYAEVTAWLNPGTPGWTWLRLLDGAGQPWQDDVIPAWSAERIGWGEGLFYYQAIVPTPAPSAAATAQLWHQPDDAEAPVMLLQWAL